MESQNLNRKVKLRKKQLQNNLYRLFNQKIENMNKLILNAYHVFSYKHLYVQKKN